MGDRFGNISSKKRKSENVFQHIQMVYTVLNEELTMNLLNSKIVRHSIP
jgi:hypothetical protein